MANMGMAAGGFAQGLAQGMSMVNEMDYRKKQLERQDRQDATSEQLRRDALADKQSERELKSKQLENENQYRSGMLDVARSGVENAKADNLRQGKLADAQISNMTVDNELKSRLADSTIAHQKTQDELESTKTALEKNKADAALALQKRELAIKNTLPSIAEKLKTGEEWTPDDIEGWKSMGGIDPNKYLSNDFRKHLQDADGVMNGTIKYGDPRVSDTGRFFFGHILDRGVGEATTHGNQGVDGTVVPPGSKIVSKELEGFVPAENGKFFANLRITAQDPTDPSKTHVYRAPLTEYRSGDHADRPVLLGKEDLHNVFQHHVLMRAMAEQDPKALESLQRTAAAYQGADKDAKTEAEVRKLDAQAGAATAMQKKYEAEAKNGGKGGSSSKKLATGYDENGNPHSEIVDLEQGTTMKPRDVTPKQAPPAAVDYLRKHPEVADQFKAKYGYVPE